MAFVRFFKKQSQEDAIQQNKERPFELNGRKLRLEYAYSKPKPGDPRWRRTPPPPRRGNGGGYGRDDRRGGYDRGGYNPEAMTADEVDMMTEEEGDLMTEEAVMMTDEAVMMTDEA